MATQYSGITALKSQAGLAGDWLKNMSQAADRAGVTLTLSEALPRMVMEASQYPVVVEVFERFLASLLFVSFGIGGSLDGWGFDR